MAAGFTLGHFLLGVEGLALLRSIDAESDVLRRRLDEIEAVVDGIDTGPYRTIRAAPPVDTVTGYGAWAETYDTDGNLTVELEQALVRQLFDRLPAASTVLDAACGTGRHAVALAERGHRVIGVDSSEAMLAHARAKLPDAELHLGSLAALPLPDAAVDAAVCALALSHERDLRPGVGEIGRVLRPGGIAIISNPHPFATAFVNWRATVTVGQGERAVIPEYPHSHADSIAAFLAAGLRVRGCFEGSMSREQAAAEAKADLVEAFEIALTGFPVVVVWLLEKE